MKQEDTHNARFAKLQEEFLENRSPENLAKMYWLVREIQSNYIYNYIKKHGLFFNSDELQDKIEDATIFVIDKYLKKKDFKIEKLSAYAHFGMLKALFKDKEKEQALKEILPEQWVEMTPTNWYEQID